MIPGPLISSSAVEDVAGSAFQHYYIREELTIEPLLLRAMIVVMADNRTSPIPTYKTCTTDNQSTDCSTCKFIVYNPINL